ncbi:MAG: MerR family transcriptional regulator [Mariprofundaceae bacterium]|nr:MerR family transcriptional regulator [Mariprofundaceae bacterium]
MKLKDKVEKTLADTSSKMFFTIGEVSKLCNVESHVLRYWETEFKHIRPLKKNGHHRLYRKHDIEQLIDIKYLLYDAGYTIKGARRHLQQKEKEDVAQNETHAKLRQLREYLLETRNLLDE